MVWTYDIVFNPKAHQPFSTWHVLNWRGDFWSDRSLCRRRVIGCLYGSCPHFGKWHGLPAWHVTPRVSFSRPPRSSFPRCINGRDSFLRSKGQGKFKGFRLILKPAEASLGFICSIRPTRLLSGSQTSVRIHQRRPRILLTSLRPWVFPSRACTGNAFPFARMFFCFYLCRSRSEL